MAYKELLNYFDAAQRARTPIGAAMTWPRSKWYFTVGDRNRDESDAFIQRTAAVDGELRRFMGQVAVEFAKGSAKLVDLLTNPLYRVKGEEAARPHIRLDACCCVGGSFEVRWWYECCPSLTFPDGFWDGPDSSLLVRIKPADFELERDRKVRFSGEQRDRFMAHLMEEVCASLNRILGLASSLGDVTVSDWPAMTREDRRLTVGTAEERTVSLLAHQKAVVDAVLVDKTRGLQLALESIGMGSIGEYRAVLDQVGARGLGSYLESKGVNKLAARKAARVATAIRGVGLAAKRADDAAEYLQEALRFNTPR